MYSSLMLMNEPTDEILQNFYDEHSETNIAQLEQVRVLNEKGAVDSAVEENAAIVDTNLVEYNSKIVNEIYLAATQNDTLYLTPAQISILQSIAYQNPMLGGEAVYRARAMLKIDVEDSFTSFRKRRIENNTDKMHGTKFFVYPVPAEDFFIVRNYGKQNQKVKLMLYDNTGRLIKIKETKIYSEISVSTIELPNGVYQLKILSDSPKEVYRIIVIH